MDFYKCVCVYACICEAKVTQSWLTLLQPCGLYSPWNSLDQNTRVGSHFLLQGIFLTQESNPGLLHCRQILYCLSHQGSPEIWGTHLSLITKRHAWAELFVTATNWKKRSPKHINTTWHILTKKYITAKTKKALKYVKLHRWMKKLVDEALHKII